MLPTSHQVPTIPGVPSPHLLAEAFSEFISASARLELSYRELQTEVQQLSRELADRNRDLGASVAENRQMRLALEQILDSMPCGVLVVDARGEIELFNPEAARLLVLEPEQMGSLDEVRRERGVDLAPGLGDFSDDAGEQEIALPLASGERWLAVRRRSLEAAVDGITAGRWVLVLRDTSARRRSEAERETARSAVALAQVSAMMAHEIRNPLASLELFAGLLEECPERQAEWISHLRAGIRSLSGMVNNVLTLHSGGPTVLERISLDRELERAVAFVRPLANQVQVNLQMDESATETYLRGNKSAIHQILLNLCVNALRHTPAGGSLRLWTEVPAAAQGCTKGKDERRILLHVEDTGSGIPKEFLPRLFLDRFSGSGSTPGLGLAVCSRLMRQLGGAIQVRSQVGCGSTFTLEFPTI